MEDFFETEFTYNGQVLGLHVAYRADKINGKIIIDSSYCFNPGSIINGSVTKLSKKEEAKIAKDVQRMILSVCRLKKDWAVI